MHVLGLAAMSALITSSAWRRAPAPLGRHRSLLRLADAPYLPAVDKYARHVAGSFENLRHLIKRHEEAVVWGG